MTSNEFNLSVVPINLFPFRTEPIPAGVTVIRITQI